MGTLLEIIVRYFICGGIYFIIILLDDKEVVTSHINSTLCEGIIRGT